MVFFSCLNRRVVLPSQSLTITISKTTFKTELQDGNSSAIAISGSTLFSFPTTFPTVLSPSLYSLLSGTIERPSPYLPCFELSSPNLLDRFSSTVDDGETYDSWIVPECLCGPDTSMLDDPGDLVNDFWPYRRSMWRADAENEEVDEGLEDWIMVEAEYTLLEMVEDGWVAMEELGQLSAHGLEQHTQRLIAGHRQVQNEVLEEWIKSHRMQRLEDQEQIAQLVQEETQETEWTTWSSRVR